MREFAEQEVRIPDGPYEGLLFSCDRQPYSGLYFDAVDSRKWSRFNATGPVQSGKTLTSWVTPIMYHLFEMQETVIAGIPVMDMAGDKWNEDLRPAIEASRYRDLLPTTGQGSRSAAKLDAVRFRNGVTLKFMSGGGSDKKRSAFTAPVLVVTETDGMDEAGTASREADKITQMEARTRAFTRSGRRRIYLECSVSIEQGRTWQEYQKGTASRIILPCPHCHAWVSPEREHLEGWREAESAPAAKAAGFFACPECGEAWTEPERHEANRRGRLIHRGQELTPDGEIVGQPAPTDTLGFRWSAVNNMFVEAGDVALDEWKGTRSSSEENAEKELRQFVWCLPYEPPREAMADLTEDALCKRQGVLMPGFVPDAYDCVTLGIDVGKYRLHWTAVAWLEDGGGRVIGYDTVEVASASMVEQRAILLALRELRDMAEQGWALETPQGETMVPVSLACVDAHWNTETVKAFCIESGAKWRPTVGFGHGQYFGGGKTGRYNPPTNPGKKSSVKGLGLRYHATVVKGERTLTWLFDADHWKTELHKRLSCVPSDPGAVLLPKAPNPLTHLPFAKHVTAEVQVEEYVPGEGTVIKWETRRKSNHWLDSTVLALLGGHMSGVRLMGDGKAAGRKRMSLAAAQQARRTVGAKR